MDLLNRKVKHSKFGDGTIEYINDSKADNAKVVYKDATSKMYTFPDDFIDNNIFDEIDEDIKNEAIKVLAIINDEIAIRTINGREIIGQKDPYNTEQPIIDVLTTTKLNKLDCVGTVAKDIYDSLCKNENFNWNINNVGKYGMMQHLYSKNATPEGYSVWFLAYSTYNEKKSDTRGIFNCIEENTDDVVEYWDDIETFNKECDTNEIDEKIVTFIQNKKGQYIFWGILKTEEINKDEHYIRQKYISSEYGK